MDSAGKYFTVDTINKNLRHVVFVYPSPVVCRGNEIEEEIKKGKKFPFDELYHVHSGDPQGMGQKPVTFFQQVVALCFNPAYLQSPSFPSDAKQRAMTILENCLGGRTGPYTDCPGMPIVRQQVAKFIQNRDGVPASFEDIILSNGATDALRIKRAEYILDKSGQVDDVLSMKPIRIFNGQPEVVLNLKLLVLSLFNNNAATKPPGVMLPIPLFPVFSATVTEYGMYPINYYLNEEKHWALEVEELRRAINLSKPYCEPKVLVIINPGNPGGFVLSQNDMQNIIKFAYEENLLILADEVYQYNVYDPDSKFYAFKKVMKEMGLPYSNMQLASLMSASKGYMAECGSRGGYCEIVNLDNDVKEILEKLHCVRLSPSMHGQIVMYSITNPPQPDEPSYELFEQEKSSILQALKEKAQYCYEKLNSVEGLSCSKVVGAMFVFPKIELSKKALKEAQRRGQNPDEFYSMELVETAGVCVLPGHLFGQRPGTHHFRLTILPQMDKLKIVIERLLEFHLKFLEKYKD